MYATIRFLLYDVNPGEGFNLRRDVYMRVASLVKRLERSSDWTLVLPPWGRIYHWQSRGLQQLHLPWAAFFHVESLAQQVPVMEYEDFIQGSCSFWLGFWPRCFKSTIPFLSNHLDISSLHL